MDGIAVDALYELMGGKAVQHRNPLGRIGGAHHESGGCQIILVYATRERFATRKRRAQT